MKRTRLKAMSQKRRMLLAERRKVRAVVLERDGGCVAAPLVPDVACAGPLDVHEPGGGAYRVSSWLDPDRCLTLCRAHHDNAHANPAWAYELGLLVRGDR